MAEKSYYYQTSPKTIWMLITQQHVDDCRTYVRMISLKNCLLNQCMKIWKKFKMGELKDDLNDNVEKVKHECDDQIEKMKVDHSEKVEQLNGELHEIKLVNEELV